MPIPTCSKPCRHLYCVIVPPTQLPTPSLPFAASCQAPTETTVATKAPSEEPPATTSKSGWPNRQSPAEGGGLGQWARDLTATPSMEVLDWSRGFIPCQDDRLQRHVVRSHSVDSVGIHHEASGIKSCCINTSPRGDDMSHHPADRRGSSVFQVCLQRPDEASALACHNG